MFIHIKIADKPEDIQATRVKANLILGEDVVITTAQDSLAKIDPSYTRFTINTHAHMTGSFIQDPHYFFL